MNLENVITELRGEMTRIDNAIEALERIRTAQNGTAVGAKRIYTKHLAPTPIKRRTMSKAARRKISQAQKARWAATRNAGS